MSAVSPLDSPKVSQSGFSFGGSKYRSGDGRRWSVASLPSSSGNRRQERYFRIK